MEKSRAINVYDENQNLRDTFFNYTNFSLNEIWDFGINNKFGYDYDFEISEIREDLGNNEYIFLNKDFEEKYIEKMKSLGNGDILKNG